MQRYFYLDKTGKWSHSVDYGRLAQMHQRGELDSDTLICPDEPDGHGKVTSYRKTIFKDAEQSRASREIRADTEERDWRWKFLRQTIAMGVVLTMLGAFLYSIRTITHSARFAPATGAPGTGPVIAPGVAPVSGPVSVPVSAPSSP